MLKSCQTLSMPEENQIEVLPAEQKKRSNILENVKKWENRKGRMKPDELAKVIQLHHCNLSAKEIAEVIGRTERTVYNVLAEFRPFLQMLKDVPQFQQVRSGLFSAAEMKLLRSTLDESKHEKASLRDTTAALKEVSTQRRLEEGKSTSNAAVSVQFHAVDLGGYKGETGKSDTD